MKIIHIDTTKEEITYKGDNYSYTAFSYNNQRFVILNNGQKVIHLNSDFKIYIDNKLRWTNTKERKKRRVPEGGYLTSILTTSEIEQARQDIKNGACITHTAKKFNVSASYFTHYGITKKLCN